MQPKPKHNEFQKYFGINDHFIDFFISKLTGKYSFDIIKFDKWLHSAHGYIEEKHGSCKDFVLLKFGKETLGFINNLLK